MMIVTGVKSAQILGKSAKKVVGRSPMENELGIEFVV